MSVTDDATAAVAASDLSLVCVATPSRANGSLDTTYLERVMTQIGQALVGGARYHVVAVRSTVLPGVVEGRLVPLLAAASGRRVPEDIGVCVNPEFLREGSALADFEAPPFTVVGESDRRAGDVLLSMYGHLTAPVHRVRPDEASMVEVRQQQLPRAEGGLRQRDWRGVRAAWRGRPDRDAHLLRGS